MSEHKIAVWNPNDLKKPCEWRIPSHIILTCDLFHPDVSFGFVDHVVAVMALSEKHTFQVLTKHPERMTEYIHQCFQPGREHHDRIYEIAKHADVAPWKLRARWPLPNLQLTSVENQ